MFWKRTNRISDEELDWAIRAALRAETEGLQPPPEVWQRVRAQIEAPTLYAKQKRDSIPWQRRAASLLQGAVLAVLALGIGVTFTQRFNVTEQPYLPAPDVVYVSAPRASLPYADDMLSVGRRVQMAQQPVQPAAWRLPE